jgi:HK97 family phage major capsid protein
MNQYEKRNRAIDEELRKHAKEYKAILDKAEEENRQPTEEDRGEITEHMQAIETLKAEKVDVEANIKTIKEVDELSRDIGGPQFGDFGRDVQVVEPPPAQVKTLGDQFIEAKGYKELVEKGLRGEWSTGQIELETKGTLATTPGTALTPTQYQPGVVETLFQRLTIADLLATSTTTASNVAYVEETTATNAADSVAEQGVKPESTLAFSERTEPVRKIATLLPVTDEMLEDAPQIQAYINQRLQLFIKTTEENQIVLGSGTAPDIRGFVATTRAIGTYARGTVDNNAVALFKAINGTRGSSFLDPDAIVMHPDNWETTRLLMDANDQFYGGGPFTSAYAGSQGPVSASQFVVERLWNVPVVVTSAITTGTALLGSFRQAAELVRRSGITVEATNSHSTYFATNISTLRAEERIALKVYRPVAFTAVTGLS